MYSKIINEIEINQMRSNIPNMYIGDFIKIEISNTDSSKKRLQIFNGILISKRNKKLCTSITLRRYCNNIGIEYTFFIHSKNIKNINIIRHSIVNKSKLYFLRKRTNKLTKIKEKIIKNKKN